MSSLIESFARHLTRTDVAAAALFVVLLASIVSRRASSRRVRTTKLNGPKGTNPIVGLFPTLLRSENPAALIEGWVKEFGPVFSLPTGLGRTNVTITDVKAASHFLARDTGVYHQTGLAKIFIENLFGRGLLWAEEDDHRRQRKALTPAFSVSATRSYLSVFYDSAYKIKSNWETLLDNGSRMVEVQSWMNHASLDDLGIAGFGHDFGALDGNDPEVIKIFEAFERPESSGWVSKVLFILGPAFPILQRLPARHNRTMKRIKSSMAAVADMILVPSGRKGSGAAGADQAKSIDKSIMGLLVKAETAPNGLSMSEEEVLAQNTLLFAGYETTSISLTWALIELSRHQDKQAALREEFAQFEGRDPTWEELSGLPYLNSITQEVLRLHPPLPNINRTATEDDVIPLSNPITTAAGETTTQLVVAKGTTVACPIAFINQSEELWGPDAKEFKPERWIEGADGKDGIGAGAKAIQGYHHLLTFSDGPRLCLGRNFAIGNFKATLSVLIRNFSFELPDGVVTKIGSHRGILARPKLEGQNGPKVPLIVKRIE
ncbi:cytochrome P450 [Ephemerocybe angulata]|uniref:Cytochrome P450 n=1 Tax=Ephemerocybe angulata TaxID=980116 RepID=A0A8H6LZD7_9AGAR|nr:cytochrome P450 [Tulosesus angulatus]